MISLKVTPQEAMARISRIPHSTAIRGAQKYWRIRADGRPDPRSICWLYCWAKTGMNSRSAASEAERAFNAILDISFATMDKRVDYEWAQEARYATRDIGAELSAKLKA